MLRQYFMTKEEKRKNKWLELLRFTICGVIAALTDYIVAQFIVFAFNNSIDRAYIIAISTAIGFIVSVIVNYLISTFWVFQNVADKEKTKTPKFIMWFILLSIGGLLLSIGAMEICNLISEFSLNISVTSDSLMNLIKESGWGFLGSVIFWAYIISFGIKTLIGLIYNYFTRKYILYKAPKEENLSILK